MVAIYVDQMLYVEFYLRVRSKAGVYGEDESVRRYVSTLERIYVFEVLKQ